MFTALFSYIKGFVMIPQVSSLNQANFLAMNFIDHHKFGLYKMILVDKIFRGHDLILSPSAQEAFSFLGWKWGTSVICLCLLDVQTEAAASYTTCVAWSWCCTAAMMPPGHLTLHQPEFCQGPYLKLALSPATRTLQESPNSTVNLCSFTFPVSAAGLFQFQRNLSSDQLLGAWCV